MTNPEILPPDQRLETITKQYFADLLPALDEFYDTEKSFIQTEVELANPQLFGYACFLADILCDNDASKEAERVSYEALFFAYTVGNYILPRTIRITKRDYLANVDKDNRKAQIRRDAQEFLSANPTLKVLISAYTPVLDPSCIASEVAETVAAITFMHIEAGSRVSYFKEELLEFDRELDS